MRFPESEPAMAGTVDARKEARARGAVMNPGMFSLDKHGIAVAEVYRNASPAFLYEAALRYEGLGDLVLGRADRVLRQEDRPQPDRQAHRRRARIGDDVWWGNVNIKLDPQSFVDQPRARDRLPQHARPALRRRRLRRLGPEVPAQDPRDLRARLPRAVHAQHADPPDAARSCERSASPTTSSTTPAASRRTATRAA